ncbi:alpha/beta hydrolase [Aliiroseovarius sp. S1339]|uniref:alpha/beta hydrolase n=1 Tax=Aliiroseovarius sp. S1339 TaxID=2936990 RepID=UPI0020C0F468|nr:alpha/beta hydrolase [Aliiroseovarius sp. S1339]MCK8464156.1 alpha/beta hydrolase [Aliiroseovarius sp. S1339]
MLRLCLPIALLYLPTFVTAQDVGYFNPKVLLPATPQIGDSDDIFPMGRPGVSSDFQYVGPNTAEIMSDGEMSRALLNPTVTFDPNVLESMSARDGLSDDATIMLEFYRGNPLPTLETADTATTEIETILSNPTFADYLLESRDDRQTLIITEEILNGLAQNALENPNLFTPSYVDALERAESEQQADSLRTLLSNGLEAQSPFVLRAFAEGELYGFDLSEIPEIPNLSNDDLIAALPPLGTNPFQDETRALLELRRGDQGAALEAIQLATQTAAPSVSAQWLYGRLSLENPDGAFAAPQSEAIELITQAALNLDYDANLFVASEPIWSASFRESSSNIAMQTATNEEEFEIALAARRAICAVGQDQKSSPCLTHRLLYATTRDWDRYTSSYLNESSDAATVSFGVVNQSVVANLVDNGRILTAAGQYGCAVVGGCGTAPDVNQDFDGAPIFEPLDGESLSAALTREIAKDAGFPRAVVFIHGFNVEFEEATHALASIMSTARVGAQPILMSWHSQGRLGAIWEDAPIRIEPVYREDRNRVMQACHALRAALGELATAYGEGNVDIIAHSMGAFMLYNIATGCSFDGTQGIDQNMPEPTDGLLPLSETPQFRHIVIAAGDVSVARFTQSYPMLRGLAADVTIYVTRNDPVLGKSVQLNEDRQRIGQGGADRIVLGETRTVDASLAEWEGQASDEWINTNHRYFINTPAVRRDIAMLLNGHAPNRPERCLWPSAENAETGTDNIYFIVPNCL